MIESATPQTLGELEGHPPKLVVVVRDNNHAVASLLFSNSPSEACTIRPAMLVGAAEVPILLLKYRYSYCRALLENATSCFCGEWSLLVAKVLGKFVGLR